MHVQRRAHIDALDREWRGQRHRSGHQRHLSTGQRSGLRQRKAHFSAGQIGDAAHRVYGLVSRPGRHQHVFAKQGLGRKHADDLVQQFIGLEHAPVAGFAAGLLALTDAEHMRAIGAQLRHIALRGRVRPHFSVHGGSQQQRHAV